MGKSLLELKNYWPILVAIIGIAVAWGNGQEKINNVDQKVNTVNHRLDSRIDREAKERKEGDEKVIEEIKKSEDRVTDQIKELRSIIIRNYRAANG